MKGTKKLSTINILLIIQLVIMIVLSTVITRTISSATRKNSIEHMQTAANERAHIIESYVKNSERILQYYSKSAQIKDATMNPSSQELIDKAYDYTLDYSNDVENLEGIYVSEWNTHVLAHTNFKYPTVDMTTRTDPDALKQLQDAMLAAGDGVYNTGMIISPASGQQVVSMYKAVYDDKHKPVGLVGLGIFTSGLINTLDNIKIKGVEDATYSMVNVRDGKYVFNNDPELVEKVANNSKIKSLCSKLNGKAGAETGSFEYKKDGVSYISIYAYIPEYDWILMIDDTKSEVYALSGVMRIYMVIFAVVIVALFVLFAIINRKQERVNQKLASTIIKNNKTKESLYSAMFKDVLTDVSNRIAFSMDLEDANATTDDPYYFVMYNICGFSSINSRYGNDTGDWLLIRCVDVIRQVFKNAKIYRTGSDEFVVAMQVRNKEVSSDSILNDAKDALQRLNSAQNTPSGKLTFKFASSVAKKNGAINSSVITVLKDMLNKNNSDSGQIGYIDMD